MTLPAPPASAARLWFAAARPKTLAAGVVPVVVASAFAWRDDVFDAVPAAAALIGALLIQVGTNYANDYHDHRRGADAPGRVGPARASASGWFPPRRVLQAAILCFVGAAAVGSYLVLVSGWPILLVGLVSLAFGYAYTGGPYPLGYHGWGDALVFVFFGPVAVAGTYYVQAGPAPWYVALGGAAAGAQATALLVVNNLRDVETDRRAGKRTLAVLLGERGARAEYALLLAAAFAIPAGLALATRDVLLLLPWVSLPVALDLVRRLRAARSPRDVDALLPRTAQLLALHGALLAAGVVL